VKKYLAIFNLHSLAITLLSIISSFISLRFQLSLYVDFLIFGLIIAFPLTFLLGAALRRRERALEYLSLFKASLQSVFYAFQNSKLIAEKKDEFKKIAYNISDELMRYLLQGSGDASAVQTASHSIFTFITGNKQHLKRSFSLRVLFYVWRVNECIEFLLATKRHHTPWGVRAIVLFAIYAFVIFYPASLLHDTGFNVTIGYMSLATVSKGIILISLYNVRGLLEDPFNQNGPDDVRLNDFRFLSGVTPDEESPGVSIIEKADHDLFRI